MVQSKSDLNFPNNKSYFCCQLMFVAMAFLVCSASVIPGSPKYLHFANSHLQLNNPKHFLYVSLNFFQLLYFFPLMKGFCLNNYLSPSTHLGVVLRYKAILFLGNRFDAGDSVTISHHLQWG